MGKKNKKIRRAPDGTPLWYAAEWLTHLKKKQSAITKATDFSKGQVSEWVTCRERFNADVLHKFAKALGIQPFQLLLPPTVAGHELFQVIAKLDPAQRDRALRVLRAADITPSQDKAA